MDLRVKRLINQLRSVAPEIYEEIVKCNDNDECIINVCMKYLKQVMDEVTIMKLVNQAKRKLENGELII